MMIIELGSGKVLLVDDVVALLVMEPKPDASNLLSCNSTIM